LEWDAAFRRRLKTFLGELHPDAAKIEPYDVVTAIGILEYFEGFP